MDADDLEFHLRQLDPSYTVPASFTRPDPNSTAANNGDRVSVITFGLMYSLLATGYSVDYVNQVLEQQVRRVPEQYVWLHRRFKTRPPGEAAVY